MSLPCRSSPSHFGSGAGGGRRPPRGAVTGSRRTRLRAGPAAGGRCGAGAGAGAAAAADWAGPGSGGGGHLGRPRPGLAARPPRTRRRPRPRPGRGSPALGARWRAGPRAARRDRPERGGPRCPAPITAGCRGRRRRRRLPRGRGRGREALAPPAWSAGPTRDRGAAGAPQQARTEPRARGKRRGAGEPRRCLGERDRQDPRAGAGVEAERAGCLGHSRPTRVRARPCGTGHGTEEGWSPRGTRRRWRPGSAGGLGPGWPVSQSWTLKHLAQRPTGSQRCSAAGALGPQEGWFFFCSEFPHFLLLYFPK